MNGQTITTAIVAAVVASSVGFGISQASQPEAAGAAGDPSLKTLKSIQRELKTINADLGEPNIAGGADVIDALDKIRDHTFETCQALDGGCYLP